jgi:hypothetical protein
MAKKSIGKLPPRYSFILNPYADVRLSKCPRCQKLTYLRKFALFIHIDAWGPMALGKTCRYCSRCELIMAHQDELEAQLAHSFSQIAPEYRKIKRPFPPTARATSSARRAELLKLRRKRRPRTSGTVKAKRLV